ncbi:MAG TPA: EAL domain-containing protein, partial [Rhodocyclaceae bacterium]
SERKAAERDVVRLNRVLTILSEINKLIIYTRNRQQLLEDARRIIQDVGGFPGVWIKMQDGEQERLIATQGLEPVIRSIYTELDKPSRRCWPKRSLHCQSMHCCDQGLSGELQKLGLKSMLHLPLQSGETQWGDIGILGGIDQVFSDHERELLNELAANLSYALESIHQEERRHIAEDKLELSARVFENNTEGIIISDADNRILMVNKAFTALTGYGADEVIGQTPSILSSGRHDQQFYRQIWAALARDGEWRGEIINRRKNGEDFPEWLTISVVRGEDGRILNHVAIFSDLSARRKIEERLDFLAHHDSLTALPNREHFHRRLEQTLVEAKHKAQRVAVLYMDLDRFKLINESAGHTVGDLLLVEVASRLLSVASCREDVARLGGDQFAVMVPAMGAAEQAEQFVTELQAAIGKPVLDIIDQDIHISASIGISVYPEDSEDADTLLLNADSAMYKAIEDGGNTHRFFHQAMNERASERISLEGKLYHALERGELSVVFQPFVEAETGRVVGAEALLRWHREDLGGSVSPTIFIPLMEEIGLIRQVGKWVLNRACQEVKRWQAIAGDEIFVAVNISALQLDDDLPGIVANAITEYGIAPRQLEIELTESAVMRDAERGIELLHRLKALGIQLSIDDFGTGYSSLSYLKRLPMTTLKIDRSFVSDMPDDLEAVSITRAILALGRSLNLNIIAEGVEAREQVEMLRDNGCDLLQGYYFAKAMTAEAFRSLLKEAPVYSMPPRTQPIRLIRPEQGRSH